MPVTKLAHYSIRTTDLKKSCRFYERILGFKQGYRPPFDFLGVWLYQGDDERDFGTVHIAEWVSRKPQATRWSSSPR
jgi:catechol 2,3-dioxygenase-like lactoylglutathione lyase family enzyme